MVQHPARTLRRTDAREPGEDDGFMLIEVLVAIGIVAIVMLGLGTFLLTMVTTGTKERASQAAVELTTVAVDRARAVGAARAVSGRDPSSGASQLAHSPATPDYPAQAASVANWLNGMQMAYDTTAASGAGATAALPTVPVHQSLDGYVFSTSYFVGYCWRAGSSGDAPCTATQSSSSVQNLRVVVVTAWSGTSCPATGCTYATASLLNGIGDPVFNFNQTPPQQPALTPVPNQTAAVGDTVNGITVAGCTAPCPVKTSSGVLPFVFSASGLPPGLTINPATGIVTGSPTTTGTFSVSVTVTDAFLNVASTTFSWQIFSTLTFTTPANQSSVIGNVVSLQVTGATGGSGAPYTWAATGLPPGLSINASTGKITGTVTGGAMQPFQSTITLTDNSGSRNATGTFSWTVPFAPFAAGPATNQSSTVGQTVNVSLSGYATGGSGQVAWSDPATTLPPGLAIAANGTSVTGSPTTAGSYPVSLTGTDLQTGGQVQANFTWTVYAAPTVQTTNQTATHNKSASYAPSATCGALPCTVTVTGLPSGITLKTTQLTAASGTITMSGTAPSKTGTYTVQLTLTDADGVSVTSSFTWTVK